MDSITQIALGGAVGYAVLGNKVGRKAVVWGAILGTLPDLDVFLPYGGEVESFTYHRGFSHSLLVHLLLSPIIAWLISKLHSRGSQNRKQYQKEYRKEWFWLVFLCLTTHAVLDSFTVYGTQLMWPFTEYPVGVSNLFIIDPLYTLPLLLGIAAALMPKMSLASACRANTIGLVLSSVYICWSLVAKVYIDHKVEIALNQRGIKSSQYVTTPAPLTTLLWRVVVMEGDQYYEGYASVFDSPVNVSFNAYPTDPSLLNDISDEWGVQRLQWFTKGFYSVRQRQSAIILSDLRMGVECSYVFNFAVGKQTSSGIMLGSYEKKSERPDLSQIGAIWDRIWDHSVSLAPNKADNACSTK